MFLNAHYLLSLPLALERQPSQNIQMETEGPSHCTHKNKQKITSALYLHLKHADRLHSHYLADKATVLEKYMTKKLNGLIPAFQAMFVIHVTDLLQLLLVRVDSCVRLCMISSELCSLDFRAPFLTHSHNGEGTAGKKVGHNAIWSYKNVTYKMAQVKMTEKKLNICQLKIILHPKCFFLLNKRIKNIKIWTTVDLLD